MAGGDHFTTISLADFSYIRLGSEVLDTVVVGNSVCS